MNYFLHVDCAWRLSTNLNGMEKEREGIIKDCIAKGKYSVVELNIRLYEEGYQILGNKGAN